MVALVNRERDEALEAAAKLLVDHLTSAQTESALADYGYTAASVRTPASDLLLIDVNYSDVASKLPEAVRRATNLLEMGRL